VDRDLEHAARLRIGDGLAQRLEEVVADRRDRIVGPGTALAWIAFSIGSVTRSIIALKRSALSSKCQ
jgi:hypothetical protein